MLSKPIAIVLFVLALGASAWGADQSNPSGKPLRSTPSAPPPVAGPAPNAPASPQANSAKVSLEALEPEPVADADLVNGYTLGVGDVVRLTAFQQPDMTTEMRVSETGTITAPLVGVVHVSGLSARQAEDKIARLLRARGFVKDPQVNVTVLQFKSRQMSVLGYVNRPGRYVMEEGVYRITDALALAGGIVPAAADVVTLLRVVDGKPQRYELDLPGVFKAAASADNLVVRNGDTIYVDRAPQFYIYGEVQRPGPYRLEKGMTVMQALSVGGGLTPRGSRKDIQVSRSDAGRVSNTSVQLTDVLKPEDVVYVKESLF